MEALQVGSICLESKAWPCGRSFYRTYQERSPQIWQKLSAKLALEPKSREKVTGWFFIERATALMLEGLRAAPTLNTCERFTSCGTIGAVLISQKPSRKLPTARIRQTASGKSLAAIAQKPSAQLSLTTPSPYVFLLDIRDENERRFNEIKAAQNSWSLPEFKWNWGRA